MGVLDDLEGVQPPEYRRKQGWVLVSPPDPKRRNRKGMRYGVLPPHVGHRRVTDYVPAGALHPREYRKLHRQLRAYCDLCCPLPVAASLLGTTQEELVKLAKAGELPMVSFTHPDVRRTIFLVPWPLVDRLIELDARVVQLAQEVDDLFEGALDDPKDEPLIPYQKDGDPL